MNNNKKIQGRAPSIIVKSTLSFLKPTNAFALQKKLVPVLKRATMNNVHKEHKPQTAKGNNFS